MTIPLVGIDRGGAYACAVHQDRLVLAGSGAISDLVLVSQTGTLGAPDFRLASTTPVEADSTASPPIPAYAGGEPVIDPDKPPVDANGVDRAFRSQPNDGFWFQQTSSRSNTFHAMIQQEGLFIFGDLGEASVPSGAGQAAAFTADQVVIRENSWYGTEIGRTVLIVGGLIVFIQKGGQDVRGINWSEERRKYDAISLITLSGNLFDQAVDMSYAPSKDRRSDTIYLVGRSRNTDLDGQLAVMLLRHQEPFYAWSRWRTAGRIIGGAAPLGNRAFLVERGKDIGRDSTGENTEVALELLAPDGTDDLDAPVDAPVIRVDTAGAAPQLRVLPIEAEWIKGLSDLDGLTVWLIDQDGRTFYEVNREEIVRRNGLAVPDSQAVLQVRPDGTIHELRAYEEQSGNDGTVRGIETWRVMRVNQNDITLDLDASKQKVRVGMRYERYVESLPFVARKQTGTSTRIRPARIMEVNVDVALRPGQTVPPLGASAITVEAVANRRGGRTRIRKLRTPRHRRLDTGQLMRLRYGGRAGYYDRVALRVSTTRHTTIAGLAYRTVS